MPRKLQNAKLRQSYNFNAQIRMTKLLRLQIKAHESDPTQQHQLNLIVDRLKAFIANSETSNTDKLCEEIKNEIKELNEKVSAQKEKPKISSHFTS